MSLDRQANGATSRGIQTSNVGSDEVVDGNEWEGDGKEHDDEIGIDDAEATKAETKVKHDDLSC